MLYGGAAIDGHTLNKPHVIFAAVRLHSDRSADSGLRGRSCVGSQLPKCNRSD